MKIKLLLFYCGVFVLFVNGTFSQSTQKENKKHPMYKYYLCFDSAYTYVLEGCTGNEAFYQKALEKINRSEYLIELVKPPVSDSNEYKMALRDTPKIKKRILDLINSTGDEPPEHVCMRLTAWMGYMINSARIKKIIIPKSHPFNE